MTPRDAEPPRPPVSGEPSRWWGVEHTCAGIDRVYPTLHWADEPEHGVGPRQAFECDACGDRYAFHEDEARQQDAEEFDTDPRFPARQQDDSALRFIEWLGSQRPMWQRATCCSFGIGSHYNADGSVGGDLVPPHEPVIDPDSGVVSVQYKSIRDVLTALPPSAPPALDVERLMRALDASWADLLAPLGGQSDGLRRSAEKIAAEYALLHEGDSDQEVTDG